MGSLNPDFLLKEELEFEVSLRGETPATNVSDLRKQLRGLIRTKKPTTAVLVPKYQVEAEVELCKSRAEELLACVEDLGDTPLVNSVPVFRLRQRLEHLDRRLKYWVQSGEVGDKWDVLPTQQQIREALVKISVSQDVVKDEDGAPLPPKAETKGPSMVTDEANVTPSAVPVTISQIETRSLLSPTVQPRVLESNLPTGAESSQRGPGTAMLAPAYASYTKLPNPLGLILQQLPSVDGLNVGELMQFFRVLYEVRAFPGMTEAYLMHLIFPHCRSPLSEKLLSCLGRGGTFDDFHRLTLESFIPGRLLKNLQKEHVDRLQQPGETLANYAVSIKQAAKVLRSPMTEEETVQTILEGVTPEERSRLVLVAKPKTFSELEQVILDARVVAYNDSLRQSQVSMQSTPYQVMSVQPQEFPPSYMPRQPPRCYYCKEVGHIRRFCHKLNQPAGGRPPMEDIPAHNHRQPKNGPGGKAEK